MKNHVLTVVAASVFLAFNVTMVAESSAQADIASAVIPVIEASQVSSRESREIDRSFQSNVDPTTENLRQKAEQLNPAATEQKTAEDLAYDFLGKAGISQGWHEQKQVFVAIGVAGFDDKTLENKADLVKIRGMKAVEAQLLAKRDIIEFIRTDLSINNVITLPETGLDSELDKQIQLLQKELAKKVSAYEKKVQEAKRKEEGTIGGVDVSEIMIRGIASALGKFEASFDIESLQAKNQREIEAARQDMEALQTQIDDLKVQVEKARNSLAQENKSEVATLSSMPLMGAMTVAEFESLVDGQYQVAFIMTWSGKQERAVRAMLNAQKLETAKGRESIDEFIAKNDWSTAIGGRKFLDSNGDYHVLGIGAWPVQGRGSADRRAAQGFADTQAMSYVALALRGDVEAKRQAQAKVQEVGRGEAAKTYTTQSMAESITESLKNFPIQGMSKRYGRVLTYPLSGEKMYVSIYSLSVNQSLAAREMERVNYQGAVTATERAQQSRGVKAGLQKALTEKEQSQKSFDQGVRAGMGVINGVSPSDQGNPTKPVTEVKKSHRVHNGSMEGAGSSTDAFGF